MFILEPHYIYCFLYNWVVVYAFALRVAIVIYKCLKIR